MSSHMLLVKNKNLLAGFKNGTFLEIGSERGQGSTLALAKLAAGLEMQFLSIDVDPEISGAAAAALEAAGLPGTAVCEYGEKFLQERQEPVHIAYLDAFDFWHPNHPQKRIDAYASRGTEITNQNCWRMHLLCAIELVRLVVPGGIVCFDDILNRKTWEGKGKLAIPHLLKNGFELVLFQNQGAVLRRKQ